jgi:hypothetical protein
MSFSSVLASAFTRAIQLVPIGAPPPVDESPAAGEPDSHAASAAQSFIDFDRRCLGGMRRVRPAATVAIGAQRIVCANWSMGGFLVTDCDDVPALGETVTGTFHTRTSQGQFVARVVRSDADCGLFAVSFTEIDPDLKTAMRRA